MGWNSPLNYWIDDPHNGQMNVRLGGQHARAEVRGGGGGIPYPQRVVHLQQDPPAAQAGRPPNWRRALPMALEEVSSRTAGSGGGVAAFAGRLSLLRRGGEVLYVGKARSPRKRVSSYFPIRTTAARASPRWSRASRDWNHGRALRGRGACCWKQPHQDVGAALQHSVSRRQELRTP